MADVEQQRDGDGLVSIDDAVKRLGVVRKTVYNMRKAGILKGVQRGVRGGVWILESSLRAAMSRPDKVSARAKETPKPAPVVQTARVTAPATVAAPGPGSVSRGVAALVGMAGRVGRV